MKKEIHNMTKQHAWHETTKSLKLHNFKCMKCKWVFKIKQNDVYYIGCLQAQSVAWLRFFQKISPIVNETMFKILLLIMIKFCFLAKIVMVKQPFCMKNQRKEF